LLLNLFEIIIHPIWLMDDRVIIIFMFIIFICIIVLTMIDIIADVIIIVHLLKLIRIISGISFCHESRMIVIFHSIEMIIFGSH